MKVILTLFVALIFVSCQKKVKTPVTESHIEKPVSAVNATHTPIESVEQQQDRPDFITGDFDGDMQQDSVFIVTDAATEKASLKIKYARGKIDVLGQGNNLFDIDDYSWVGVFEKVQKGEEVAPNVDEDGEFYIDEIPDSLYTTLPHDGIFIHNAEACGGGIIYLDNGQYKWIQQE